MFPYSLLEQAHEGFSIDSMYPSSSVTGGRPLSSDLPILTDHWFGFRD